MADEAERERAWEHAKRRYAELAKVWAKSELQRCPECFVLLPLGMMSTAVKLLTGACCPACGAYFADEAELDARLRAAGMMNLPPQSA